MLCPDRHARGRRRAQEVRIDPADAAGRQFVAMHGLQRLRMIGDRQRRQFAQQGNRLIALLQVTKRDLSDDERVQDYVAGALAARGQTPTRQVGSGCNGGSRRRTQELPRCCSRRRDFRGNSRRLCWRGSCNPSWTCHALDESRPRTWSAT
jgi:hypothetical protein